MLETGIRGEAKEVVSESNSAQAMKSGELKVYATPSMIALMEQAAYKSVAAELEEGKGTVGTLMNFIMNKIWKVILFIDSLEYFLMKNLMN